ncbi:SPX domain-containing protein [Collybia nuda]|uniref:SPX domain-containing protein n=1 Tax=Collybia nuda TaxID=64659 RepID=A0A9P5Y0B1_9AGAR|nr:SPX domain-containing protein [Collybia nuda]
MKFARYLEDTQTPEWKKAYIDYRGLKKLITAVRKAQEGSLIETSSPTQELDDERTVRPSRPSQVFDPESSQDESPRPSDVTVSSQRVSNRTGTGTGGTGLHTSFQTPPKPPPIDTTVGHHVRDQARRSSTRGRRPSFVQGISIAGFRRRPQSFHSRMGSAASRIVNPLAALPLHDLLTLLSPQELAFFTKLDAELDKIESFFAAREAEMQARTKLLHVQLEELSDHKKLVQAAHPKTTLSWSAAAISNVKNRFTPKMPRVDSRFTERSMQSSVASVKIGFHSRVWRERQREGEGK